MAKYKIGDEVQFKDDYEGTGTIVEILVEKHWMTNEPVYIYMVKIPLEIGMKFQSEQYRHPYGKVVYIEQDDIWG